MTVLLQATGLTKKFGDFTAVDDISLTVKKGEILGVLGANGAGKTTTMQMLTGFLKPTSGETVICDHKVRMRDVEARRHIGYLPEGAPMYGDMTPREFLTFTAKAQAVSGAKVEDVIISASEAVSILNVLDQRIKTLSKGYRRRVGLAASILHSPDVLILDEPTDGLDPNQKHEVRRLINAMSLERAIVISTHILEEVSALCTRVVILNEGKIVADGAPSEMLAMSRYCNAINMHVDHRDAERVATALKGLKVVEAIEAHNEGEYMRLVVVSKDQKSIADQIGELASISRWRIHQFTVENGRLDDVFRRLTMPESHIGDVRYDWI